MTEATNERTLILLRVLLPCILIACAATDLGLRLIPPTRLAFRGLDAAVLLPNGDGPFATNVYYHTEDSYGDIPNIGNLPVFRQYRPQVFSTDASGYRSTPSEPGAPMRVIVFGDSFAVGAASSDTETLSAQLARMTHTAAYNAGFVSEDIATPTILSLVKRLNLRRGLVILVHSENYEAPRAVRPETTVAVNILQHFAGRESAVYQRLRDIHSWMALRINAFSDYSPLRILTLRAFVHLRDDVWLPNVSAEKVVVRRLKNGRMFLFLPKEITGPAKPRFAGAEYLADLRDQIRGTGNELLVVLVPWKYTVYRPLLEGPNTAAGGESFFATMTQNLQQDAVPVLDLTPALREQAARLLAEGQYNYWPDDTHWNEIGTGQAARAIVELYGDVLRRTDAP
jgi:hypothetical protein